MADAHRGIIFNIQRYTIHDGPGIRTELFFKGCPLHCPWCGNPESHHAFQEVGLYPTKCIGEKGCGLCRNCCPVPDVLHFEEGKLTAIDQNRCRRCLACADSCPSDVIRRWGEETSLEEAMEVILKDRSFYESSGGGVTLSGGEPLLQEEFVKSLLSLCRREGIHTCVESTLYTKWHTLEEILPLTDLLITDIKHMDSGIHRRFTGVGNERILAHIERIADIQIPMIVRIPVIPGFNDTWENMEKTADFLGQLRKGSVLKLQLLRFMRLGEEKYASLGLAYPMRETAPDRDAFDKQIQEFAAFFRSRGICAAAGTTTREERKG